MFEELKQRRNRFLDWAEAEINHIRKIECSDEQRLREIQKTAIIALLDTLATAFKVKNPPDNRTPFAQLVEDSASWNDATRISAVHLSKAVDLHLHSCGRKNGEMRDFRKYLNEISPFLSEKDPEEMNISDDPPIQKIMNQWPGEPLLVQGRKLHLWDFKHLYLVYKYRNFLVHESREPTVSQEEDDEDSPSYMVIRKRKGGSCEYHLVYPLRFLMNLAECCAKTLRCQVGGDPYTRFRFGPYLIPELNACEPE